MCFDTMSERVAPSPLHTLNRALAVAEPARPGSGTRGLDGMVPPSWLEGSYLWDAVLSDLDRRSGDVERARSHADRAVSIAPEGPVQIALRLRLSTRVQETR